MTAAVLDRATVRPAGVGREVVSFAAIGVASTAAYAVLYLALRQVVDPVAANALALVITAVGNTAANRRLTFGIRDGRARSMLRDQLGGLLALVVALAITTNAVQVLGLVAPTAPRLLELPLPPWAVNPPGGVPWWSRPPSWPPGAWAVVSQPCG